MRSKYRDVVTQLVDDIDSGRRKPGDRLPTHRELAFKYGLALGTASRVFAELDAMGLTIGEVGRGTFVRMNADAKAVEFGLSTPTRHVVDFSRNRLVLPEQDAIFTKVISELLDNEDCDLLDYRDNCGANYDRHAAWQWLNEGRSTPIEHQDRITICSGGQHALMVALMATCQPGQTVVVERLTYPVVRLACEMLRLDVLEVESDEHGINPDAFDRLCQQHPVRLLFCMPNVQNPTSITLSLDRRQAIASILQKRGIVAVEDDAYGFLLSNPPVSLSELAPEHVFYLFTMSKSWAPGLRVSYIISPDRYGREVKRAISSTIWTSTPLMASASTRLIQSRHYLSVIQAKRREILKRQAILRRVLQGVKLQTDPRSMHVLLPLPAKARTDWVLDALRDAQVIASPISQFAAEAETGKGLNGIRLCIGAPRNRKIMEAALRRTRVVIETVQSSAW